jgi:hypothetical protein
MAEALKVLGQLAPAAATLSALYTVPGATSATVSSILVCNQNASTIKFRVSVAVANAADATKQYLYFDVDLTKKNTFSAVLGLTLGAGDVVRVYTDTTNVSFSLFGVEVT